MIIGIDGNEANIENRVGSSEYAYALINTFYRICTNGKTNTKFIIYLKKKPGDFLPKEKEGFKYRILSGNRLWIFKNLLPELYSSNKPDVFFSPNHYLPIFTPIPQVCTIHDLGYLMFSEQFKKHDFWQLKIWSAISIIISKYIIAVSDSTANDIVRHYKFASKKVETIYHGVDHSIYNSNINNNLVRQVKNKFGIRKNYILSIGTLKPSKNIEGIIRSLGKFLKNHHDLSKDYQLVIAGKKGWLFEDIYKVVKMHGLEKKVIFTGYISLKEKRALYKGARFTISPSFWEGFGMHILESMACGTPVVVSSKGSLAEIAGSAGIYADPYDVDSISKAIEKLVKMGTMEYNKLALKCFERAQEFNWENTAKETLEVLKKTGNKKQ